MELDRKTSRFVWGTALAAIPSVPILLAFFRQFSLPKQNGLGAVAGGLSEIYMTTGMLATILLPTIAIVLLLRSFSQVRVARSLVTGALVFWSTLVLAYYGAGVWMMYHFHQLTAR